MVVLGAAVSGPATAALSPPPPQVGQACGLCSRTPPLPSEPAAAPSPAGELLLPCGVSSWSSAADAAVVDDEEDEEELAPQTPPPSSTPPRLLVCPVQVGGHLVEDADAPAALPVPPAPAAPIVPSSKASNAIGAEEDAEELAPPSLRSGDDGEAGAGALPLAATPWPASWVSSADNDDEDSEEELVPRTPPATKSFNVGADVEKVDGKDMECVGASMVDGRR